MYAATLTLAFAEPKRFDVKADEFDPGKSFMVQGAWLRGIGCPTDAMIALPNATFTGVGGHAPFTDPACPTGDHRDRHVEGLLLVKTGPSSNFAAAGAKLEGVKGQPISELGWDIRKPDSASDARGSHCGAGAPRWSGSVPLQAFNTRTGALEDITGRQIKSLSIVFDEGQEVGPDNFGAAILDNIDVNGVLVGKGSTDAD